MQLTRTLVLLTVLLTLLWFEQIDCHFLRHMAVEARKQFRFFYERSQV